ncbi:hypothetical protein JXK06_03495 [Patescibacteria group bacterium]|nr:hypothetical protein [Patescibacteria group bacterium]
MEKKKVFGSWRNKILPALMIIIFFIFSAQSCEQVEQKDIKSASYWTSPIMNVEQAKKLAEHEVLIVDMENMINNKASLKLLKSLNPNIKLLAYTNPMEFFSPMPANRPIQRKWFQQVQAYPNWFLKTGNGSQAIFWPKMVMMNLSSLCPKYEIEIYGRKSMMTYSDWISHKILTEVISDLTWDGYFMDNSGGGYCLALSG